MCVWLLPPEYRDGILGGAKSPHALRYSDGWYYLFSTVGGYPTGWVVLLDRSRDLKQWQSCPFNPVLFSTKEDKLVANPKLTDEQRGKIAAATDCNNSDIDFCEMDCSLIINHSWGNQAGVEFIAEAQYAGTEARFLKAFFR